MTNDNWNQRYEIGHDHIDEHHKEIFELDTKLEAAISQNKRSLLDEIIQYLEHYAEDHFQEEEDLMRKNQFPGLEEHQNEHAVFTAKVEALRLMYDRQLHTTHIVYGIRRFVDTLIRHIITIDIKMAHLGETEEK
tara:strand:- start:236 stop:640 length:405 start_codon:yes stop_codon:yes gene_type:complete